MSAPDEARLSMGEDIVTTGLSSRERRAASAEHPGHVVGAALAILGIPNYPAGPSPPELLAIPAVNPGSRSLKTGASSLTSA